MDTKELESKLKSVMEGLKHELSGLRTNRPTPRLIEDVLVEYFDQRMPLKQLGSISVSPPRELQVSVWDKNALAPAAKALEAANLGVSVAVSGNMIRVTLPALSDERRAELIKVVKGVIEEAKIKIRSSRDDANKKAEAAEKEKKISEDEKFKLKKRIQEAVDKMNKEIEAALATKTKEIQE